MSGMRTINFPPQVFDQVAAAAIIPEPPALSGETRAAAVSPEISPEPARATGEELPQIVLYGRAIACHKIVGQQLRHLTAAEADYHGTLQVTLSQLRTMTSYVEELIQKHRSMR